MVDLVKKRAALAKDFETKIFDPHWAELAKAGDKLTDRPVAFLCDDEVIVIGSDVAKIYDGLKKFVAQCGDAYSLATNEPAKVAALSKATKALASPIGPELRVGTQTWNGYLLALSEVGINVCVTDGSNE